MVIICFPEDGFSTIRTELFKEKKSTINTSNLFLKNCFKSQKKITNTFKFQLLILLNLRGGGTLK